MLSYKLLPTMAGNPNFAFTNGASPTVAIATPTPTTATPTTLTDRVQVRTIYIRIKNGQNPDHSQNLVWQLSNFSNRCIMEYMELEQLTKDAVVPGKFLLLVFQNWTLFANFYQCTRDVLELEHLRALVFCSFHEYNNFYDPRNGSKILFIPDENLLPVALEQSLKVPLLVDNAFAQPSLISRPIVGLGNDPSMLISRQVNPSPMFQMASTNNLNGFALHPTTNQLIPLLSNTVSAMPTSTNNLLPPPIPLNANTTTTMTTNNNNKHHAHHHHNNSTTGSSVKRVQIKEDSIVIGAVKVPRGRPRKRSASDRLEFKREMERSRRDHLSRQIQDLRQLLAEEFEDQEAPSRSTVLQCAVAYIRRVKGLTPSSDSPKQTTSHASHSDDHESDDVGSDESCQNDQDHDEHQHDHDHDSH